MIAEVIPMQARVAAADIPVCGSCPVRYVQAGRTICPVRGCVVLPSQVCLLTQPRRAALVTLLAAHLGVSR